MASNRTRSHTLSTHHSGLGALFFVFAVGAIGRPHGGERCWPCGLKSGGGLGGRHSVMQIEKENRLSVLGSMFVANVFCGMRALWDGKIAIENSVWETARGRERELFVGNAVRKMAREWAE